MDGYVLWRATLFALRLRLWRHKRRFAIIDEERRAETNPHHTKLLNHIIIGRRSISTDDVKTCNHLSMNTGWNYLPAGINNRRFVLSICKGTSATQRKQAFTTKQKQREAIDVIRRGNTCLLWSANKFHWLWLTYRIDSAKTHRGHCNTSEWHKLCILQSHTGRFVSIERQYDEHTRNYPSGKLCYL